MKISWQSFLGKNHSWSFVSQNLCRSLIKLGNSVDLCSTNGLEHFPNDLKPFLKEKIDNTNYDISMSYTAIKNFKEYLKYSNKNKFGIWCYEFAGKNALPDGFARGHLFCDKILPPSEFAKQVFLDSGVPDSKMVVIPHGIDTNIYKKDGDKFNLNTDKIKIQLVIGQQHLRKNFGGALEAFGKAFTIKDNVCLVLKITDSEPSQQFEVSFKSILNDFRNKYKNHAEIKIIKNYLSSNELVNLYRSCDILYSLTHCEGFGLPHLEGLAMGLINICPNYGGMIDFLNNENSLLVSGNLEIANPRSMYWQSKKSFWFKPSIDDAVEKLRFAVANVENLKNNVEKCIPEIHKKYSWDNIANKILTLIK